MAPAASSKGASKGAKRAKRGEEARPGQDQAGKHPGGGDDQEKSVEEGFRDPPGPSGRSDQKPDGKDGAKGVQQPKMNRIAVWFRRDLRLDDNPAIMAACRAGTEVLPIFIWAPEEEGVFSPGRSSRWWVENSLEKLSEQIKVLGSRLLYFRAQTSKEALIPFIRENNIDALYFNHLYDPISLVRDNRVRMEVQNMGVHVETFGSELLYEPWEILDKNGKPFVTFENVYNAITSMAYEPLVPIPAPLVLPPVDSDFVGSNETVASLQILQAEERETCEHLNVNWTPGSQAAWAQWEHFIMNKLKTFATTKGRVDKAFTSQLSPYLHYGEISIRRIFYNLKHLRLDCEARQVSSESIDHYLRQMGYREYSRYILFHNPFTHERPMLEHLRAVPWTYDQELFQLWQQGTTGYPLVDAAMHELWASGYCHNRLRVVVAHFLVKYLNLPWQWGLKYFWDTLIDADLECDTLGWQYISGCMVDAHPYSYIMDYETECRNFDPNGTYVRKWLPLLSRLNKDCIHKPWEAPALVLRAAGVELGTTYPHRVVNMEQVRRQVEHACKCIEKKAVGEDSGPFRHPTKSENTFQNGAPSNTQTTEIDWGKEVYSQYTNAKLLQEKKQQLLLQQQQSYVSQNEEEVEGGGEEGGGEKSAVVEDVAESS